MGAVARWRREEREKKTSVSTNVAEWQVTLWMQRERFYDGTF